MRVQKWLVRGLVFSMLLALVSAGILYQRWTDPAVVRELVLQHLQAQFPGAHVTLETARLRIFGGILLTDLRLIRKDDAERNDLFYVPSAVVYHDKEHLLDGKLAIRKIELRRPRLRLIRRNDGSWNLADLMAPSQEMLPLPTVVIHEGTLLFEDRSTDRQFPPLEITDVSMTAINNELSTLTIEGHGNSHPIGHVQLHGTWHRDSGQMQIALQTSAGELTNDLVQRLAAMHPNKTLEKLKIHGKMGLQVDLCYTPSREESLQYDVHCQLHSATCSHPKLPFPLDNLHVEARCKDGLLTVSKLNATSASTEIIAHGAGELADLERNIRGTLVLKNLSVCDELCKRLPEEVHYVHRMFKPCGPIDLKLQVACEQGIWLKKHCLLQPQMIDVCFEYFPYAISELNGTLDFDMLNESMEIDVQSTANNRFIHLAGTWNARSKNNDIDLRLTAKRIPLDDKLLDALPESSQQLAQSFHPKGFGNIAAVIKHKAGAKDYNCEYHVHFYDAALAWNQFPYPLKKVTGDLHIYPHYWTFKNFRGNHGKGLVQVEGMSWPVDTHIPEKEAYRVVIEITGQDIGIDGDLRQALKPMPNMVQAWDTFSPGGKLNFQAHIDQIPGRDQDMDIAVQVNGCTIEPTFFRYPLHDLKGHFRFRKNRLLFQNVRARHNTTHVSIARGIVDISPKGGYYADLTDVQGNPIHLDDGFFAAMPEKLKQVFTILDGTKPIAVKTRLVIAQKEEPGSLPDIFWDGLLWIRDSKLKLGLEVDKATGVAACVGRHDGQRLQGLLGHVVLKKAHLFNQPFQNVHAKMEVKKQTPDTMLVGLKAPIFGGDISGQARLDFNSRLRYEMNLTASQIDLQKFGHYNLGDRLHLSGLASARLHLTGQGSDADSLDGNGTIDIPSGKLVNLPFLLDLLKFLGLRLPDRTAFEEAHAKFSIQGQRLNIKRLDLWGNAISLKGQGDLNLDGTNVNLDFYPSWARVEQLLPSGLREISPAVSKNLLKIEARGKIGPNKDDLKFYKRPVPILVDPLRRLQERVVGTERNQPPSLKMSLRRGR